MSSIFPSLCVNKGLLLLKVLVSGFIPVHSISVIDRSKDFSN